MKVDAEGSPAIKSVYTASAQAHTDLRVNSTPAWRRREGTSQAVEGYNATVGLAREVASKVTPRCLQLGVDHMCRPTPTAATTAW